MTHNTSIGRIIYSQFANALTWRNFKLAGLDVLGGLRRWDLWLTMGLQDLQQRYRRSVIGPFWVTISTGVMIAALGMLYGGIFKQPIHDYLPFLAVGLIVWGLISGLVTDGSQAFINGEGLIRQLPAPLSVHVYHAVWGNLILFGHNIWIYFLVALVLWKAPDWSWLLALPGLLLLLLNGLWIGLLLGLLSARFRDIPQILASVIQVLFFLTPIIWRPEMMEDRPFVIDYNPFYYMLEVVRGPLLGTPPGEAVWITVGGITLVGWLVAMVFFTAFRWRLAYWV